MEGEAARRFRRSVEHPTRAIAAGGSYSFGHAMTKTSLFVHHIMVGCWKLVRPCFMSATVVIKPQSDKGLGI